MSKFNKFTNGSLLASLIALFRFFLEFFLPFIFHPKEIEKRIKKLEKILEGIDEDTEIVVIKKEKSGGDLRGSQDWKISPNFS
jgi:hypothetical protein